MVGVNRKDRRKNTTTVISEKIKPVSCSSDLSVEDLGSIRVEQANHDLGKRSSRSVPKQDTTKTGRWWLRRTI